MTQSKNVKKLRNCKLPTLLKIKASFSKLAFPSISALRNTRFTLFNRVKRWANIVRRRKSCFMLTSVKNALFKAKNNYKHTFAIKSELFRYKQSLWIRCLCGSTLVRMRTFLAKVKNCLKWLIQGSGLT